VTSRLGSQLAMSAESVLARADFTSIWYWNCARRASKVAETGGPGGDATTSPPATSGYAGLGGGGGGGGSEGD
jgi:hypothetical protein